MAAFLENPMPAFRLAGAPKRARILFDSQKTFEPLPGASQLRFRQIYYIFTVYDSLVCEVSRSLLLIIPNCHKECFLNLYDDQRYHGWRCAHDPGWECHGKPEQQAS